MAFLSSANPAALMIQTLIYEKKKKKKLVKQIKNWVKTEVTVCIHMSFSPCVNPIGEKSSNSLLKGKVTNPTINVFRYSGNLIAVSLVSTLAAVHNFF